MELHPAENKRINENQEGEMEILAKRLYVLKLFMAFVYNIGK